MNDEISENLQIDATSGKLQSAPISQNLPIGGISETLQNVAISVSARMQGCLGGHQRPELHAAEIESDSHHLKQINNNNNNNISLLQTHGPYTYKKNVKHI